MAEKFIGSNTLATLKRRRREAMDCATASARACPPRAREVKSV
jgi:hypothetical protein